MAPALLVLLCLAAAPAEPPPALRVALRPLEARGVEPALVSLVESSVCSEIGRQKGVDAICPEDLAAAAEMARTSAAFGNCAPDECLKQVDAMARADRTVTGEIGRAGEALLLTLTLWEGGGTRAAKKVTERLPADPAKLLDRVPGVARKLFR